MTFMIWRSSLHFGKHPESTTVPGLSNAYYTHILCIYKILQTQILDILRASHLNSSSACSPEPELKKWLRWYRTSYKHKIWDSRLMALSQLLLINDEFGWWRSHRISTSEASGPGETLLRFSNQYLLHAKKRVQVVVSNASKILCRFLLNTCPSGCWVYPHLWIYVYICMFKTYENKWDNWCYTFMFLLLLRLLLSCYHFSYCWWVERFFMFPTSSSAGQLWSPKVRTRTPGFGKFDVGSIGHHGKHPKKIFWMGKWRVPSFHEPLYHVSDQY